jgi:signal peptidase I
VTVRSLARALAYATVIGLWLLLLTPRSLGGPVSIIWVSGSSMEPTLQNGDLALLYRHGSYQVGDIVAFDIPEGGTVIHRIERSVPGGYEFRGDNRETGDPWVLDETSIRGSQVVRVPNAQGALAMLGRPEVMAILVAVMVVLARLRRAEPEPAAEGTSPQRRLPALPWR